MEEAKSKLRCVYVQTTLYLWRFDFEAIDSNSKSDSADGSGNIGKGVVTQLIDFRKAEVSLGAGGFVFNSKLFFVGGETVKSDTPRVKLLPLEPFDDDDEFNAMYDYDQFCDSKESADRLRDAYYDSIGYIKLPRAALNKRVFVLDQFSDSNSQPLVPSLTVIPECQSQGPKTRPFVIPIKKGDKTLIYVVGHRPLYYKHDVPSPTFEVFDPDHNSWETLEDPPFMYCEATYFPSEAVFEFGGKIFLVSKALELSFDIETKMWQHSKVFEDDLHLLPRCMINLCGDLYVGCHGYCVEAYQLGPDNKIRIQGIQLLSDSCDDRWCPPSNSTLCNLGDGHVLSVFTSLDYDSHLLHFLCVRFQVFILTEEERKVCEKPVYFPFCPEPFVRFKIIDSHQGQVEYEADPLMWNSDILNAYVL